MFFFPTTNATTTANKAQMKAMVVLIFVLLSFMASTFTLVHGMVMENQSSRQYSSNRRNNNNNNNNKNDNSNNSIHTIGKNKSWYNKRRYNGIKVTRKKSGTSKPPKWEKEGDDLYKEIRLEDYRHYLPLQVQKEEALTVVMAKELLNKLQSTISSASASTSETSMKRKETSVPIKPIERTTSSSTNNDSDTTTTTAVTNEPPFLWGGLSVGPVWKSKLLSNGYTQPNPIQKEAFTAITKRQNNVIMASPTGSGKSLAYLLPLMTTSGGGATIASAAAATKTKTKKNQPAKNIKNKNKNNKVMGMVWIVTPTLELAQQLQRVSDTLSPNTLFVLTSTTAQQQQAQAQQEAHDDNSKPGSTDITSTSSSLSFPLLTTILKRSNYHDNDNDAATNNNELLPPPVMIAGTPRRFLELMKEIRIITRQHNSNYNYNYNNNQHTNYNNGKKNDIANINNNSDSRNTLDSLTLYKGATELFDNLQTIVLDEADRLLKTEQVAIATDERQHILKLANAGETTMTTTNANGDNNNSNNEDEGDDEEDVDGDDMIIPLSKRKMRRQLQKLYTGKTFTEDFVSECLHRKEELYSFSNNHHYNSNYNTIDHSKIQLICASATVGRTLRRQIMELTRATSMDKAATLITADVRTKKNPQARKASLLPTTLDHRYHVVNFHPPIESNNNNNNNNNDNDNDNIDIDNINDDDNNNEIIETERIDPKTIVLEDLCHSVLCDNVVREPGPTIIFPGRIGVERVQEFLQFHGYNQILGLEHVEEYTTKEKNNNNNHNNNNGNSWKETPIFVVNEKVSRGMDLQGITHVILLQVPNSPVGYTHLAGRTGRNGSKGTAITLCLPKEAPKLRIIAERLGLEMSDIICQEQNLEESLSSTKEGKLVDLITHHDNENDSTTSTTSSTSSSIKGSNNLAWATLSESTLKRKTISELLEYLSDHNVSIDNGDGTKKPKKADLLDAVQELHNTN